MVPRGKRLSRVAFPSVARGIRAVSAHFSVSVAPSEAGAAAAVVSKKVAKRAVDRHLLKRRVLAVASRFVIPGRSFIVYARAGSTSLPFPQLKAELEELLSALPRV